MVEESAETVYKSTAYNSEELVCLKQICHVIIPPFVAINLQTVLALVSVVLHAWC